MKIIRDELPPSLPDNTYVAMDTEWFGMVESRMHRPTTGRFACLTVCYQEGEIYLIQDERLVRKVLERLDNCVWIFHNAKFDLTHLRRLADIPPRTRLICTYLMDRIIWNGYYGKFGEADLARRYLGIHLDKSGQLKFETATELIPELVEYSVKDADVLLRIWNEQKKYITKADMKVWKDVDAPALWAVLDFRGFAIDREGWIDLAENHETHLQRLEDGLDFNPHSNKQGPEVLRKLGFKGIPNWQKSTLEKYIDKYPNTEAARIADIVLEIKELKTFASRYGKNWIENHLEFFSDGSYGFVGDIRITGAETGRMACSNPNLQNVPTRGTKVFREKFIARPGSKLLIGDWSQQEVMIMAYLSGDKNLIEICNSGDDIYCLTYTMLYEGETIEKSDPKRDDMKVIFLGIDYGMSDWGLARRLGISRRAANELLLLFRTTFPGVSKYLDAAKKYKEAVYTVSGRRYHLNPHSKQRERNDLNAPIQGTAADMMKKAISEVHRGWVWDCDFGIVNVVHDEMILDVPEELAPEIRAFVQETMIRVGNEMCPGLKFRADVHICDNWSQK